MKRSKQWRRFAWLAAAVAIVAGLVVAFVVARPRPVVEVAEVTRGVFERDVEEDGRARVRERYLVSAPLAGVAERSELEVGDAVARGSVIAVIHPSPSDLHDPRVRAELEQRRGAAEAAVERAKLAASRAESGRRHAVDELDDLRALLATGAATASELEHAELDLELATRTRDEARAATHGAEHELNVARAALAATQAPRNAPAERFEIMAPIDGVVLQVHRESEGAIANGTPLLELADPRALEVVVDLLSTDAIAVTPGALGEIVNWGGPERLRGRVRLVSPRALVKLSALGVEEERVDVVLDVLAPTEAWSRVGDGYRVDVRIPIERIEDAMLVPTAALFRAEGDWCVFVVEDEHLRRRTVELRRYGPLQSAVAAGLEEAEIVVLHPDRELDDGVRVEVTVSG